jgi:uncharacterized protein (TIGR01244 family)
MLRIPSILFSILTVAGLSVFPAAAQVKKATVSGVVNFAQVATTVACAGATTPEAVAGIKKMGFASVINLRTATEQGTNLDAEAAAAKAAGITYLHIPFDGAKPDTAVADKFLQAVNTPANQPAFIHCASGNRAAALWMIKRVVVDKWDTDRASEEATQLGLTSSALKTFALDYIQSHRK